MSLPLVARIVALAQRVGRYGYRRITALLRAEGWRVNHKRVERLWRREGLRVPPKPPRRRRLWLADGTNHVAAGHPPPPRLVLRLRPGSDPRRAAAAGGSASWTSTPESASPSSSPAACGRMTGWPASPQLFVERGPPAYLRSDTGPEFTAHAVRAWLPRVGVTTLFIQPGSPWENGYVESCNGKLRDECLNREIFTTLVEAQVLIERWRQEYRQRRPHSALGYRSPAPPRGAAARSLPAAASRPSTNLKRGTKLGDRSQARPPTTVHAVEPLRKVRWGRGSLAGPPLRSSLPRRWEPRGAGVASPPRVLRPGLRPLTCLRSL